MDSYKGNKLTEKGERFIETAARRLIYYIEGVLEEKGSFDWQDIARILKEELTNESINRL